MNFGQWLKAEIECRGLTQIHFSTMAGVSYPALRAWISQPHPNVRGVNRARLAKALGCDREEIDRRIGIPSTRKQAS